jgi:hypothetical protein
LRRFWPLYFTHVCKLEVKMFTNLNLVNLLDSTLLLAQGWRFYFHVNPKPVPSLSTMDWTLNSNLVSYFWFNSRHDLNDPYGCLRRRQIKNKEQKKQKTKHLFWEWKRCSFEIISIDYLINWWRVNSVSGKLVKMNSIFVHYEISATKRSREHCSSLALFNKILFVATLFTKSADQHHSLWHYSLTSMCLHIVFLSI